MTWRLGRAQALLAVMLLLGSPSLAEEYHVDAIYNISVGHAMRLPCDDVENGESRNVMWRRKGGVPLDTDAGVEVRGNAIWFLPAQAKHSGVYECNGTYPFHIQLNVDSGSCPEADFDVDRTLHTSGILNCRVNHISRFINTTITWLKECKPLEKDHIFIKPTQLRLKSVEKTDAGNYTCVLHFNREGRNYTSARTTRLQVHVITEPSKPQIIVPANETRVVEMGSRQELRCEVIAVSDEFTTVMWNISDSDSDSDFNISKVDIEGRHVTTLTIFKVQPKFLEVPFICVAQNSMGLTRSQILLTQANHRSFYWLVVVVSLCGLVMLGVLLYRFFKLDLVLFYRSHCPRLHQHSGLLDSSLLTHFVGLKLGFNNCSLVRWCRGPIATCQVPAMTWRLGRAQALLAVMLLLGSPSLAEKYHVDVTYNIIVGHAMRLPCGDAENGEIRNVMWRRKGGVPLDTDAGVEVRGNAIWFLPAQAKHSGVYECNGTYPFHIQLNVDSGSCPEADFDVGRTLHTSGILNCRVNHISRFINTTITWLKECKPLEKDHIFIKPTRLRIKSVEKTDAGNYTCMLHFNREGRNYTSARTTRLKVHVITEPSKPQIIVPANETRVVEMGSRQELRCEVIAVSDESTNVMWNISDSDSDFNISKVDIEGKHVTTLTIFKVQPKFLEVPFICVAQNSMGLTRSQILLTQANHRSFYWLVVVVSLCGLVMLGVLLYRFFKLDLVLFYRSHCPRLHQRSGPLHCTVPGSVSMLHGISMAMTFALRILPEVLENKHGYKLFIRGRDDSLGEEVFDVIEDALKKSRRFVIVLDGDTHTATDAPTHTEPNTHTHMATHALTHNETDTHTHADRETHTSISAETITGTDGPMLLDTHTHTHTVPQAVSSVCVEGFEQSVGLYDALVSSGPKVIVIQTGQGEITLPPSLSLHTHSKRTLRWRTHTHTHSQRRFWKKLRYLMPVAQRPSHKPYLA
ncbi:uncharacterized protein LOC105890458 [Clupea harengus]|uniref:Uncharacterized protein LOC105890458 n=1 Tax=Clupea harengus TaxID=7950 RepID=A0A6P8FZG4_CLUHA|nr:uncharacterized protein LOC105890458 [Clupea harengus]